MVKAKTTDKSKVKAKHVASASSSKKNRTKELDCRRELHSVPSCCDCGEIIEEDNKAVQREKCADVEVWKCARCLDLTDDLYDQLVASSKCNLHWFCVKCEAFALDAEDNGLTPLIEKLQTKSDDTAQYLTDTIAKMEQNVLNKVDAIEQTLQKKADSDLLLSIENRLQKIEDRPVDFKDLHQRLENKVDQLNQTRNNIASDVVIESIHSKLQEDEVEKEEIQKRCKNVIVFGLNESASDDAGVRIADDLEAMQSVIGNLQVEHDITKVVRLRKKNEQQDAKPRPLLVSLRSEEERVELLKKAKNLKDMEEGGLNRIFILPDLTPKQRQIRKNLVQELKKRQSEGETGLMIVGTKIVRRRK